MSWVWFFLTWECWMIRQHMSLSHEKVVLSGSIWVCLMRKWCYQAAYECLMRKWYYQAAFEFVSWESGIIRQHMSLSHGKVVLSGSIWVCLMRKWYYQTAFEFFSWGSGIIRQHQSLFLSHSHEDVDWLGSVLSSFFCPTHMRVLTD